MLLIASLQDAGRLVRPIPGLRCAPPRAIFTSSLRDEDRAFGWNALHTGLLSRRPYGTKIMRFRMAALHTGLFLSRPHRTGIVRFAGRVSGSRLDEFLVLFAPKENSQRFKADIMAACRA